MVDFGEIPERERNFMRLLFNDPRMRSLYPDWEGLAHSVVSYIPDLSAARLEQDGSIVTGSMPKAMDAYLEKGSLSLRARELALQLVENTTSQYGAVIALTSYLQHSYTYTLDLGHVPPGRDPVDWFLFDVKAGYCEQFATAAVLMFRSVGIPARLVTGYATGDYDPVLNQAVVRERDAHAWVEVWFPHDGCSPTTGRQPGWRASSRI